MHRGATTSLQSGATGITAWAATSMNLGLPVAGATNDWCIRITYAPMGGQPKYLVSGTGYDSSAVCNYIIAGKMSHATSTIDELQFSVSTGTIDGGNIAILATYI